MKKFWNFVVNAATEEQPETVELRIDGPIVSDNRIWLFEWLEMPASAPNAFRNELKKHNNKDITVWINSNGGDVFAAAGIYDALRSHSGKVTAKVETAMSAASVIAMAADEIQMSPVGVMMIHNPLTGAEGDMHVMRKTADVLDTVKETIVNAYMAKTRKSRAKISAMMDDETWMSSNVAIKKGFADSVMFEEKESLAVVNFSFERFSVVNSANESIKQLLDLQRVNEPEDPAPSNDADEEAKQKILMEIELI